MQTVNTTLNTGYMPATQERKNSLETHCLRQDPQNGDTFGAGSSTPEDTVPMLSGASQRAEPCALQSPRCFGKVKAICLYCFSSNLSLRKPMAS